MGFSGSPALSVQKYSNSDLEITNIPNDNHMSFLGVSGGLSVEKNSTMVFSGRLVEEVIKDGLPLFTAGYRHVDRN